MSLDTKTNSALSRTLRIAGTLILSVAAGCCAYAVTHITVHHFLLESAIRESSHDAQAGVGVWIGSLYFGFAAGLTVAALLFVYLLRKLRVDMGSGLRPPSPMRRISRTKDLERNLLQNLTKQRELDIKISRIRDLGRSWSSEVLSEFQRSGKRNGAPFWAPSRGLIHVISFTQRTRKFKGKVRQNDGSAPKRELKRLIARSLRWPRMDNAAGGVNRWWTG